MSASPYVWVDGNKVRRQRHGYIEIGEVPGVGPESGNAPTVFKGAVANPFTELDSERI